jgi:hypothetical protein
MKSLVAATMSVACLTGLVAGCSKMGEVTTVSSPPPPSGPGVNGTFTVELGPITNVDGGQQLGTALTQTWALRSACRETGCVATAAAVDPQDPKKPPGWTGTFDLVNGRWVSVSEQSGMCDNVNSQLWHSYSLEPRPDGSLAGTRQEAAADNACPHSRTVTLRRTGDVDPAVPLADPASLPQPTESPGAGLRGRYSYVMTNRQTGEPVSDNYDIWTYCLRTGDRCLSSFITVDNKSALAYVFADGKWTMNLPPYALDCTPRGQAQLARTGEILLPEPPQNPFPTLSGSQRLVYTGDCPSTREFDVKIQRIGDTPG